MTDETQDNAAKANEIVKTAVFSLADDGSILWDETPVAKLVGGVEALRPDIQVLADDPPKERMVDWLSALLAEDLGQLIKARDSELKGSAQGLVSKIVEALGQVPRKALETQIKDLSEEDHKSLTMLGIRFGVETLYMPHILKPAPQRLKSILWTAAKGLDARPDMPVAGRVSFTPVEGVPPEFYEVLGYRVLGGLVVRVDMLERFAAEIRHLTKDAPAELPHDLLSVLGIGVEGAKPLITALGYRTEEAPDQEEGKPKVVKISRIRKAKTTRKGAPPKGQGKGQDKGQDKGKKRDAAKSKPVKKEKAMDPDSPFAVLKNFKVK